MTRWYCSGCNSEVIFDKKVNQYACRNCGYVDDYYRKDD